jgi:molecular chaperone DnaK (HSP70)
LRWFKLLLETEYRYEREAEQVISSKKTLEGINKSPQDAVADYLHFLWLHAKEHIRHRIPEEDDDNHNHEPKVVITVPAMWSDVAKDLTRRAAEKAGILGEISLVSEPEAAALAAFKDRITISEPLKVGVYYY